MAARNNCKLKYLLNPRILDSTKAKCRTSMNLQAFIYKLSLQPNISSSWESLFAYLHLKIYIKQIPSLKLDILLGHVHHLLQRVRRWRYQGKGLASKFEGRYFLLFCLIIITTGIYILAISPPPWVRGDFCPNWKTGKNLKEDFMKRRREKGGK